METIKNCPVCGKSNKYVYHSEEVGLVEEYYSCSNCGYFVQMTYSPTDEGVIIPAGKRGIEKLAEFGSKIIDMGLELRQNGKLFDMYSYKNGVGVIASIIGDYMMDSYKVFRNYGNDDPEENLNLTEENSKRFAAGIAEHLVKNGVLIPRCKVGDTAYFVIEDLSEIYITEEKITDVSTKGFFTTEEMAFNSYKDVGEDVFFSRKEAEVKRDERIAKKRTLGGN